MNASFVASDLLGYAAAAMVLVTFLAQSITALRALAIVSNVLFIVYAALAWLPPVLLLHALLLPLNAWRLWQAQHTARAAAARVDPELGPVAPARALASFRAVLPPMGQAPLRYSPGTNRVCERTAG
jgi:hypothetical protein